MSLNSHDEKDYKELNKAFTKAAWSGFFFNLLASYFGAYPFLPGCLLALKDFVPALFGFYPTETNYKLRMNFVNLFFSLAPAWILLVDPCALVFAQSNSVTNTVYLTIYQQTLAGKAFHMIMMIISWAFVWFTRGSLIQECQSGIGTNLGRDIFTILFTAFFVSFACGNQLRAKLKIINDALSQVKELNGKFEKVNAELQQLLDDKDNFILLFSHETRNPLNILLGNLTLLLDEVDIPHIKNKLIRCKFCADLLLQHLNNILDTGKLSSKGTLEIAPTAVRIYEYLQSTASFMEMLVKKKNSLKPELMIPQKLPANLKFDMQRLTQVILNLLTNAVKFTSSGSITMVVRHMKKEVIEELDYYPTTAFGYLFLNKNEDESYRVDSLAEFGENPIGSDIQIGSHFRREIVCLEEKRNSMIGGTHEKGFLKIEIYDTGCGMKEEELTKLFKKFSQTHAENSQRQIGSGLGLWITKTLCELMNGGIRVYSKPGMGTCFSAIIQADSLPVPTKNPSCKLQSNPRIQLQNIPKRRVLIADDDPFNLDIHTTIMRELGFDLIETASDGQDLFYNFKTKPEGYYEIIITDVAMPRIDGIQAALKIREFEEAMNRRHSVRIGFITGHSNTYDKEKCEKHPILAHFYLSKPITHIMLESFLDPKSNLLLTPNMRSRVDSFSSANWKKRKDIHISPLVLCVDDDMFNLDCISDLLKSLGANAIRASSGEEALMRIKEIVVEEEKNLSLILMDCKMSGIDGWTTSQRIKELLKTCKKNNIPIIGLTGEDKERNIDKFMSSGMENMIKKPATREDLQSLLKIYE